MKTKIDRQILKNCGQACINSYEGNHGNVESIFDIWEKHERRNVVWFFGTKGDDIYITIKGTHNGAGWVKNLKYNQMAVKPFKRFFQPRVHQGFYDDLMAVYHDIIEVLNKYHKENLGDKRIIITGHSKGANVSLLLAVMLNRLKSETDYSVWLKDIYCVALAPARIGNIWFRRYFRKLEKQEKIKAVIFKYKNDLVCNVPTKRILGFRKLKKPFLGFIKFMPSFLFYCHCTKVRQLGKRTFIQWLLQRIGNPLDHYPQNYFVGIFELYLKL